MDHDLDANTAPMHDILQDALDDLASPRTSLTMHGDALIAIEHVLAETSDPRALGLPEYFNMLQDTFQCNVSSRIIAWTASTARLFEKCLNKGSIDHDKRSDVATLSAQLAQAMTIVQGVALVHKASKQFLGRRYPLEVLLDLLLVSRHLNPVTSSVSTPTSPKAAVSPSPVIQSAEIPLASVVIDTMLCILVDSIPALRVFEELNGVQVVVKILKRAGTPREVRMKCLEFLYFYLLDETTPPSESLSDSTASSRSVTEPVPVTARTTSPSHRSTPSLSITSLSDSSNSTSSRSSSSSSAFSSVSTSTAATSATLHDPPTSTSEPFKCARKNTPFPRTVIPGVIPSQRMVTPPAGGLSAIGRGQPRSLLMLKKEVDYIPLSPKKPELSHLGRGPSGLRPKDPNLRATKLRGTSDILSSEDTEGEGSGKSTDAPSTPRTRIGLSPRPSAYSRSHSRRLSVSSISSASSNASSTASTPPQSSLEPRTPRRDKTKERERASFDTPKPSPSKLHRRTQSLAEFGSESPVPNTPLANLKNGPRSASSPTPSAKKGPRTMEEKKEILGTMLGNVDALVEGVKRAGVWGLS